METSLTPSVSRIRHNPPLLSPSFFDRSVKMWFPLLLLFVTTVFGLPPAPPPPEDRCPGYETNDHCLHDCDCAWNSTSCSMGPNDSHYCHRLMSVVTIVLISLLGVAICGCLAAIGAYLCKTRCPSSHPDRSLYDEL